MTHTAAATGSAPRYASPVDYDAYGLYGPEGSPAERFATLRRELGDAFEAIEIDSSPGNAHGIPQQAHSVLTEGLVDTPGHPTRAALDRVLAFLAERLRP